jgi:hypothetical protein
MMKNALEVYCLHISFHHSTAARKYDSVILASLILNPILFRTILLRKTNSLDVNPLGVILSDTHGLLVMKQV